MKIYLSESAVSCLFSQIIFTFLKAIEQIDWINVFKQQIFTIQWLQFKDWITGTRKIHSLLKS